MTRKIIVSSINGMHSEIS